MALLDQALHRCKPALNDRSISRYAKALLIIDFTRHHGGDELFITHQYHKPAFSVHVGTACEHRLANS